MITRSRYTYKLIIWSLMIAYLCFSPSDGFKKVNISIPHIDKVIHFLMFYIFGLLSEGLVIKHRFPKKWLIILGLFYALLIEIIQYYCIISRNGDLFDFIADSIGLWVGILTYSWYPKFVKILM